MQKKATSKSKKNSSNGKSGKKDFLVVGLGASAGGVKALQDFFASMPPNSGMAFVVILHLSPEHESNLAQILQTHTQMPVMQVTQTEKVEPNHVYVIPPSRQLEMVDGVVRPAKQERPQGNRVAIDVFFRTLADAYERNAVCVVLSGTGSDGTLGLKRVKESNGFAIVQHPEDAEYDSMPRSAIATQLADWILPVNQMPEKLLAFRESSERLYLTNGDSDKVAKEIQADESLREILTLLRVRTGHDFSTYKTPTLIRRIARHLQIHELEDIPAYLEFLRNNPNEIQSLLKNLLINVTNFFRDKEAFKSLESEVIPNLFAGKTGKDTVRVWSAGCASGEEAYSIAMLLSEHAEKLSDPPKFQVFASDVDDEAIQEAREHRYPHSIETDVSAERLKRFFTNEGSHYVIRKELRETVLFAPHNILRDPPFSRLDLISCRNLLIYLNRETQERVLQIFHFALNQQGYLFLGSSESAETVATMFAPVNKKYRIYLRRSSPITQASLPMMPVVGRWDVRLPERRIEAMRARAATLSEIHYKLLESYAPSSVLVNQDFDIVYLSSTAGKFLRFSGGEPSRNLLKAIEPDLLPDLRAALFTAQREHKPSEFPNVRVVINDEEISINLIVCTVDVEDETSDYLLVIFEEKKSSSVVEKTDRAIKKLSNKDEATETLVRRLEEDLQRAKEHLRTTIEQHETTIEELQASNEELQAINEELRSASEELETSKEELQSVNEELTTVNHELKEKMDEASRINSDLQNLIAATEIATIFLDKNLRIKRYTPPVQELFNITPTDIGRPLEHFTHRLRYENLAADAETALRSLILVEREITDENNRSYISRFSPYRTIDDRIDGVVLNFIDITERKQAEEIIEADLRDMRLLRELGALYMIEDIQVLYNKILEVAIALTFADAGTIQMLDEKSQELILRASKGFSHKMRSYFSRVDVSSQTPCGIALAKGVPVTIDFNALDADDIDDSLKMHLNAGYVSAQSIPLITRSGRIIGMFTTHWREHHQPNGREVHFLDLLTRQAADLIEQRQSDDALYKSREQLSLIVESTKDYAIITFDIKGNVTRWNKGAEKIFGYTEKEAVGQYTAFIFTPEDRAALIPEKELKTALEKGRADDERWHLRKDGTRFFVSGVMQPLKDGKIEGFVKIARDQTERIKAEETLREREILKRHVVAQEDERRRIARDIHDHFGQQITSMKLKLDSIKKLCAKGESTDEQIDELIGFADRLDREVDFIAWELRPAALDDLGLRATLNNFIKEWAHHTGINAEFHTSGLSKIRLDFELETNLYRIAQEALNNIYKHANAKNVSVLLEKRGNTIVLIIEDDGTGFNVKTAKKQNKGMGLNGMEERAKIPKGTLEIESKPKRGTTIFARVPVNPFEEKPKRSKK